MMIIDLIFAVILGIVEGITEWLPVSSTAHLILITAIFDNILSGNTIFTLEFKLMFDVVVQLGAIIAICIIYYKKLYPFKYNNDAYTKKDKFNIWIKVLIACVPIIILGLLLDDIVTYYFYNLFTISLTLIIYGLFFIIVENFRKNQTVKEFEIIDMSKKNALSIGLVQVLAIIPGTSRSGITIIFSRMLGLSKVAAAEFSFFLSIPIMFGASLFKIMKYLLKYSLNLKEIIILLIGMLVALLVSLFIVKKLIEFIKKYSFKAFGIYRIILGVVILIAYFMI